METTLVDSLQQAAITNDDAWARWHDKRKALDIRSKAL
jgi:hypothetical protein